MTRRLSERQLVSIITGQHASNPQVQALIFEVRSLQADVVEACRAGRSGRCLRSHLWRSSLL